MKRIISLVLCFIMFFSFNACSGEDNNAEKTPATPIEALDENEKDLFDALLIMSDSFFNPSEMRLLDVGDPGCDVKVQTLTVRIQGENKSGGVSNDYYKLYLKTLRGKDLATAIAENEFNTGYYIENWNESAVNEYPRSSYDTLEEYKAQIVEWMLEDDFFHTTEEMTEAIRTDAKNDWDESADDEYPRTSFSSYEEYLEFCYEYYGEEYHVVTDYDKEKTPVKDSDFGSYEVLDIATIAISEEDEYDIAKINKALKYYWDKKLGNL